jgi:hypothetical protein
MAATEHTAAGEATNTGDLHRIRVNQVENASASSRHQDLVQRRRKTEIIESDSSIPAWKSNRSQSLLLSRAD